MRVTIAGGVPAGASKPYQVLQSKPGYVSAMVGTSGATRDGLGVAAAMMRSRPALTNDDTCGVRNILSAGDLRTLTSAAELSGAARTAAAILWRALNAPPAALAALR